MPGSFFDSNVPLYLAADDNDAKAERADALLASGGTASVQVLNEIANVGLRKFGWSHLRLGEFLSDFRCLVSIVPVTIEVHEVALQLRQLHRFAIYDAAIVAAAVVADCDTLWSEDMHHGLVVDGRLTIRNPFLA